MRASPQQQQALASVLTKLCDEICAIEAPRGLTAGEGDFRPRIEYFHDAVRALTSGMVDPYASTGRLSVEHLAYDMSRLRQIEAAPLVQARAGSTLSPRTEVATVQDAAAGRANDRETRARLSELYGNYAVMFAALLCEPADRNYQSRVDDLNAGVEELSEVEALLKDMTQGKPPEASATSVVEQMQDPVLRAEINKLIHDKKARSQTALQGARHKVKTAMAKNDKEIERIEKAHFTYVTGQLAVYENAKDTLKKLAGQGMNLAGQFVQSAISEAAGRTSRGR